MESKTIVVTEYNKSVNEDGVIVIDVIEAHEEGDLND